MKMEVTSPNWTEPNTADEAYVQGSFLVLHWKSGLDAYYTQEGRLAYQVRPILVPKQKEKSKPPDTWEVRLGHLVGDAIVWIVDGWHWLWGK